MFSIRNARHCGEPRGNTAHRAQCTDTTLTPEEHDLCLHIGQRLFEHGIHFAGLNLASPYVLEYNVVNPSCLNERLTLGLPDRAPIRSQHPSPM
ncbi:ATP-grasp domain-containing protein [Streptomyces prasinus]